MPTLSPPSNYPGSTGAGPQHLYFFPLITEEGFLISSCYSLEHGIQMLIPFLFSFAFCFSSFHNYLLGLLTSWEIDGETVETVLDFIFGGSKITADGDCSHEIKRCLLLGRKVMTNLDSIFKSRDIANKGPSSQGYGFSCGHVWM